MEFLLPVFLKLFPNMLPSTFQDKLKEEEAMKRRLKARIEYAKFLQETAMDMAKEVQNLRSGEIKQIAEDLDEFVNMLHDWLDSSLNHFMPSSLLILSRAFYVSGKLKPKEAVRATLISLPDEVVDTINVTSLPSEDSVSERRRKSEYLEMQEEMIKEEEEREKEELRRIKESKASQEDVALKEMTVPTTKEAQDQAKERTLEKQEQLCELSRALDVLASASSVSTEREEF